MLSPSLIDSLDLLIARLCSPASDDELRAGWTLETKTNYAKWFQGRKDLAMLGKLVPHYALVRSLDMFGICDGELFDEALHINREMSSAAQKAPKSAR